MFLFKRPVKDQKPIRISRSVMNAIRDTIGKRPSEYGGMLGGVRADGLVSRYHFDATARRNGAAYSPDCDILNRLLSEDWNPSGVNLLGFVHSHPVGVRRLSAGDMAYAEEILKGNPNIDRLLMLIVQSIPDTGAFECLAYAAVVSEHGLRVEDLQIELAQDEQTSLVGSGHSDAPGRSVPFREPSVSVADAAEGPSESSLSGEPPNGGSLALIHGSGHEEDDAFRRVATAYDLPRLARCRIIYVGLGGAASYAEDCARSGVGEHVLIDPDTVSLTNIATQQAYRRDLGRPKVECVAERLRDINPGAAVVPVPRSLDEIDDAMFAKLALEPIAGRPAPVLTVLCGLTDNFEAQARVNRLALHFGFPSLCAQVYREGRGAEITFTYPGLTPACHRCILSSRYKAYLMDGFKNNVGSDGTPIFATERLNSLKGFVTLALLHHGTGHPRWGGVLSRIATRNLVQVRMDPDIGEGLGLLVFDRTFENGERERVFFDEALWLPQNPSHPRHGEPVCPDCGGEGDLRKATGTFDTRTMRR